MTAEIRPLAEINRQATSALIRELGVADTLRFLGQFSMGSGDYTKERAEWFGSISLDEITGQIKLRRTAST